MVTADPAAWDEAGVTEIASAFADLNHWPPNERGLLLVDGVEALGPTAAAALDRLFPAATPNSHVVVAGRAEAFRGMQPWQRAVTLSRTGVLLRPGPEDGDILRLRLPRETPLRPVPGRGYLVDAGGQTQIQVAFLPPGTGAGHSSGTGHIPHRVGAAAGDLAMALALPAAFLGEAQ